MIYIFSDSMNLPTIPDFLLVLKQCIKIFMVSTAKTDRIFLFFQLIQKYIFYRIVFENIPKIRRRLETIQEVGLGYVKLGQSSTTLSGGEAQRVKLATELSKRSTGKTVYILDEPTTGLHSEDVRKLISVLNKLVDAGNSVIVIEHNLDVIKTADYIIDLGPEGGDGGGTVIAKGTPEQIAKSKKSYTGKYLKNLLQ